MREVRKDGHMSYSNSEIMKKAESVHDYAVNIRRTIHKHPEVGMQEFKTAALIRGELDKMGIPYRDKVGGTGVVGLITGTAGGQGKVIGLRADMDAISVQEINKVPYASEIPGISHACGHDAHVAMLLAAAKVLNDIRDKFSGSVKLLFQPAEEGPGGAKPMIEDGALENPKVDAVVGFHVSSAKKTGKIGLKSGPVHAAQDEINIVIKGKGGHAASPHKTVDAVVLAAQAVSALQTVVSRKVDPTKNAVLTIGTISGGYRHNIIADRVEMTGTYRFFDEELKMNLRKWTEEILAGVTRSVGGDFEITYKDGYPGTINSPVMYEKVKKYLNDLFGTDTTCDFDDLSMGAEDFSYFCKAVPSMFIRLGTGGKNGEFSKPHHSSEFDVDEEAFINGIASFVKISLEFLNEK
jgi:amidohydrolase